MAKPRTRKLQTMQVPELPPELPVEVLEPAPQEERLFDDEWEVLPALPGETAPVFARPDDGIPPLDTGLTPDEKQEFVRLLNQYMPLKDRAVQLVKLAMFTDTKRAPVGLRALQEINAITNISGKATTEAPPMFMLPADAKVSVSITKVVK